MKRVRALWIEVPLYEENHIGKSKTTPSLSVNALHLPRWVGNQLNRPAPLPKTVVRLCDRSRVSLPYRLCHATATTRCSFPRTPFTKHLEETPHEVLPGSSSGRTRETQHRRRSSAEQGSIHAPKPTITVTCGEPMFLVLMKLCMQPDRCQPACHRSRRSVCRSRAGQNLPCHTARH